MQVYGDLERVEEASLLVDEIRQRISQCQDLPAGLQRHQKIVAAFIRASELVQGVVDADFAVAGEDDATENHVAGASLLLTLAQAVAISWDSGFRDLALPDVGPLHLLCRAGAVRTKQAEGYAFYAVYPEAYLAAARQSGLGRNTTVIGIRSIGASLAAVVAAAIGARPALTVRPVGHPFSRKMALSDALAARLQWGNGDYAIVDEGPGLSGSSLNCVADWLAANGVDERRIHFFPSHNGDLGAAASAEHRKRWSGAAKHVVPLDEVILEAPHPWHRLENWIAAALGPLDAPLYDLSGGAWRKFRAEEDWPPADPAMERLKFLALVGGKRWLAKFAGIGTSGEAQFELARRLSGAGFAPEPACLCHGFIVLPWIDEKPVRQHLPPLARVLDYLACRASLPPTNSGASLSELFAMAANNFGEHWGAPAEAAVRSALGDPQRFHPILCCTDNRMHAWEWIHGANGWQKLDALDHHAAHDMIGCQDIAWDIAGASTELAMSPARRNALTTALGARIGRRIDPDLVAVCELCYLGFQIGLWSMALARNGAEEHERIQQRLDFYDLRARQTLQELTA